MGKLDRIDRIWEMLNGLFSRALTKHGYRAKLGEVTSYALT